MKTWVKALLAGSLALGPAAAFAAIDNTHHDVPYLGGLGTERCAYCHSKTGVGTPANDMGKVGNFCVQVCHIAGSTVAVARPNAIPTSPGTFTYAAGAFTMANGNNTATVFTAGHGRLQSALGVFNPGEDAQVDLTGWPYSQLNELQCTSCHSVHDATNPPFLNARLTDGTQTGNFCARCHNDGGRIQDFSVAGDHPTEFEWDPAAANGRNAGKTGDAATVMNGRDLVVGAAITNLNVAATNVANGAALGALNALNANWNMGGHVINPTTGLPQDGTAAGNENFGCYSCHTVHVAQTATNGAANILTAGGDLTDVCYGCHTMEPGRTGFGHPIDEDVPVNKGLAWEAVPLTGVGGYADIPANFRNTTPATKGVNSPYCVTCHDVHNARASRMAIRSFGTLPADGAVCELCHGTGGPGFGNPTVANRHHPGSTAVDYVTADGFIQNTAWYTTDGLGDLDDGLSCGDCHIGDGSTLKRATAHNWQ